MFCRPQIRHLAAWMLAFATAFLPAAAQPNRDKNTLKGLFQAERVFA
jgi:hypothetical protein